MHASLSYSAVYFSKEALEQNCQPLFNFVQLCSTWIQLLGNILTPIFMGENLTSIFLGKILTPIFKGEILNPIFPGEGSEVTAEKDKGRNPGYPAY